MPGYGAPDQYQQEWNQQAAGYPQASRSASRSPSPSTRTVAGGSAAGVPWADPAGSGGHAGQPAQTGWAGQAADASQAGQPAQSVQQPIIQDGWQWDPQAQQWIPAPQPSAQQPDVGSDRTQVRPPDGS